MAHCTRILESHHHRCTSIIVVFISLDKTRSIRNLVTTLGFATRLALAQPYRIPQRTFHSCLHRINLQHPKELDLSR